MKYIVKIFCKMWFFIYHSHMEGVVNLSHDHDASVSYRDKMEEDDKEEENHDVEDEVGDVDDKKVHKKVNGKEEEDIEQEDNAI